MKALFIGGTGTISTAITRLLASKGHEIYLLNRGSRSSEVPDGVTVLKCDVSDEQALTDAVKDMEFDVVSDFIAFVPSQLERDYRVFKGKTKQFMFISSASAYQKPLSNYQINEGTPLANPFWEYSRNKIACEDFLMEKYREEGFPVTIVRPSHTYDERSVPLGVHGRNGSWQVVKRIIEGKPVIIHGDGTSLWTMTHNSDFAKAYVGLMDNVHALGEAVQITSDEVLTWNQIYESIARAVGKPLNAVHVSSEFLAACSDYDFTGSLTGDKANSVVFDNTKLKRLVPGFCAEIRFDQGVKETIEYIMQHPVLQQKDPEFDQWCDTVISVLEEAQKTITLQKDT
ncbi:MAG TPA: SDR family oxidoreductase [Treponemataceae bacterium]|nr:SDR family oxidoreductase [Treponemataceae bacterium]